MIYLGIGSNLSSSFGDRFKNINLAVSSLEEKKINLVKKSSFYETFSYPNKENPKFINIVIAVKTSLSPKNLMESLMLIEEKLERKRLKKNDPRTCDIDIIDYNKKCMSKNLTLPHPRLHKRNFVLLPLFELDKSWYHPVLKSHIKTLLLSLSNSDIRSIKQI